MSSSLATQRVKYYPDAEPNIIDELFLSLTLMRQIFKIIYDIIENQRKMDQIAFMMHTTETKFAAICRKQFPITYQKIREKY